jgi:hypothetical protein
LGSSASNALSAITSRYHLEYLRNGRVMAGNEAASDLLGYRDSCNSGGKGQKAEKGGEWRGGNSSQICSP